MQNLKYISIVCMITALSLLSPRFAFSHANSVSYSNITIEETTLTYNLMTYVMDLWQLVWIDDDNDGMVSESEIMGHREEILEYLKEKVLVFEGERLYEPEVIRYETVTDTSWGMFQVVGLDVDLQFEKERSWSEDLTIACLLYDEIDYLHQSFALIQYGEKSKEFVFFNDNAFEVADLLKGPWADAWYYFMLGFGGFLEKVEYLVFLCGILMASGRRINLAGNMLAFGAALVLTLWLSGTDRILLDTRFVDAAIGLTIAYIGIENFFTRDDNWRWLVTGFFGLIYGFSVSLLLRYVGVAADEQHAALFMFGAGVWGALAVVTVAGAVIYGLLRRFFWYPWIILKGQSTVLVLLGAAWCYERFAGTVIMELQGEVRAAVTLLVVEALFIIAPLRWYSPAKETADIPSSSADSQTIE